MKNKNVLKLDWSKYVNLSFCESIIEFDPTDEKTYSSTEVWIQDQLPWLKQVAEERLKSRQEKRENKIKMPLRDMIKRMKSFQEFGKDPEKFDKRYMKIFIESWWNAEQIWPF